MESVDWEFYEIVGGLRKGRSISQCESSVSGLLSGNLEIHGEEGSGDGHHSPWGAPLGNIVGGSSTGALRRL